MIRFSRFLTVLAVLGFATVATADVANNVRLTIEPDMLRAGRDYKKFELSQPKPELCRAACAAERRCKAYSYIKPGIQSDAAVCRLKSGLPRAYADTCCVSGKKQTGRARLYLTSAGGHSARRSALMTRKGKYDLAVLFVRLADNDGTNASRLSRADAEAAIARTNRIFSRNRGDLRFHIDPKSDFSGHLRSNLLNQDCRLGKGQTPASIAGNTKHDLNNSGKGNVRDGDVLCDRAPAREARTAVALMRPASIVVFSRGGARKVSWDGAAKTPHWRLGAPKGGMAAATGYHVVMPARFADGPSLAHALGHYLHLVDTYGPSPRTLRQAAAMASSYMVTSNTLGGLKVFDPDANGPHAVKDTPPDANIHIFKTVHRSHCHPVKGTITLRVATRSGRKNFTLAPDRKNIMSGFTDCPFPLRFSRGQYRLMHMAITKDNRLPLIAINKSCYRKGAEGELNVPGDPEAFIKQRLRRIATCTLLQRQRVAGSLFRHAYASPADSLRRSKVFGKLRVNETQEHLAYRRIMTVEFVE